MDKIEKLMEELGLDKCIPYEIQQDEFLLGIFKKGLETLLDGEMDIHLGYPKNMRVLKRTNDKRNGYYQRSMDTSAGRIEELNVPRDRECTFETRLFGRRDTRMDRIEKLIIGMYSKGVSTADISDLLNSLYHFKLNPQTISNVVKRIDEEFERWKNRPLLEEYAILFIDALHQKIRRETVSNEAIYLIIGVTMEGHREFLGLYVVGGGESSYCWQEFYEDLYQRGVRKVLLGVMDGLAGNEEAFKKVFPKADVQECVVHHMRAQMAKTRPKHKEEIAEDSRRIYEQIDIEQAKGEIEKFTEKWKILYPSITKSWNEKFYKLTTFMKYPLAIRKSIYTTNYIERMNREFRRVMRNKSSFPTPDAAIKLMYLKIRDLEKRYSGRKMHNFDKAFYSLKEMMDKRYAKLSQTQFT